MYNPEEHPRLAESFARLGASVADMAAAFGVEPEHVAAWMEEHAEFRRAVTRGSVWSDMEVAESLFKRATGYIIEEDKIVKTPDGYEVVPIRKHIPSAIAAATWWLKNRRRTEWSDRPETGAGENEKMEIDGGLPEMPYEQQELQLNAEDHTPDTP